LIFSNIIASIVYLKEEKILIFFVDLSLNIRDNNY